MIIFQDTNILSFKVMNALLGHSKEIDAHINYIVTERRP